MSGLLDFFGKKKAPKSQLPILREEEGTVIPLPSKSQLPAAPKRTLKEQLLSIFEPFEPGHPTLPEVRRSLNLVPEQINLPAPIDIIPEQIRETPRPESKPVPEEELFSGMFEETKAAPEEIFEFVKPSEEEPTPPPGPTYDLVEGLRRSAEAGGRPLHADWPMGVPPLYWSLPWRIPSPFEIAYRLQETSDLSGLWEFTLQNTDYPGWRREVEESAHTGEPAKLEIEQVAHWNTAYEDLANYFKVPASVLDKYFGEIRSGEEGWERGQLFFVEVLQPLIENHHKALDALRPPSLRGFYEYEEDDGFNWWLTYKQGKFSSGG